MSLQETTVSAEEIAGALGITKPVFMRKVGALVENDGMPERLPGRRRWSRPAIDLWLRTYGDKKASAQAEARTVETIATDRAHLRAAYCNGGPRLVVDNSGARA